MTARLLHWRAESGAHVREGDILAEMETTKAVFEIHAPAAGIVQYTWPREAEVPVGETLCRIYPEGLPDASEIATADTPAAAAAALSQTLFSKKAREMIAGAGLSESDFAGLAFVTEADVREKLGGPARVRPSARNAQPVPAALEKTASPTEDGDLVPLERAKLYENRELLASARTALKSTLFHLCPA